MPQEELEIGYNDRYQEAKKFSPEMSSVIKNLSQQGSTLLAEALGRLSPEQAQALDQAFNMSGTNLSVMEKLDQDERETLIFELKALAETEASTLKAKAKEIAENI